MDASIIYTQLIIFFISLCACALFSFLETSITALRLFKLKELAQKSDNKYKRLFGALEKNPQEVTMTIIIANNVANTTSTALITSFMENIFASLQLSTGLGFSVGIGIAAVLLLVFGEIIPKSIARSQGDRFFGSTLWLTSMTYYIFYPVASFLTSFSNLLIAKLMKGGAPEESTEWVASENEIKFLIDHISQKGLMESEKTMMLQNIFELGQTQVKEIMIPGTDIISVNIDTPLQETLSVFTQHHFTRLPVYQETRDNIIGIVHLKDIFLLLSKHEEKQLKNIIRSILFVPETLKVNQLLRELRQQHVHMAIVLNEHGIVTGLITLEDVLEEIVGEISDEHELSPEKYIQLKQDGWLMEGSMPLEEVADILGISFDTEDSVTLGGFLTERLQKLPKKDDKLTYKGFVFNIQKATHRRIYQVLVFKEQEPGLTF